MIGGGGGRGGSRLTDPNKEGHVVQNLRKKLYAIYALLLCKKIILLVNFLHYL